MNISTKQLSPAEQKAEECRNAKIEKTAALLEYLAIMTDVEIPEEGEGTTEKEAENE